MLAQEISKFPQACMLTDRRSAYRAMYDSASTREALENEFKQGVEIFEKESIAGKCQFILAHLVVRNTQILKTIFNQNLYQYIAVYIIL